MNECKMNPNVQLLNPNTKYVSVIPTAASASQLNMRGVFLHVLGDALGSVIVIMSAIILMTVKEKWKYYFDPAGR